MSRGRIDESRKRFSGAQHPAVTDQTPGSGDPAMAHMPATFADYQGDAHNWITLATGQFYPDILVDACLLYTPVLVCS